MITPPELDELERLAKAAMPKTSATGVAFRMHPVIEVRGRVNLTQDQVNYLNACSPDKIDALITAARRAIELEAHCAYLMQQVEELDRTLAEREGDTQ